MLQRQLLPCAEMAPGDIGVGFLPKAFAIGNVLVADSWIYSIQHSWKPTGHWSNLSQSEPLCSGPHCADDHCHFPCWFLSAAAGQKKVATRASAQNRRELSISHADLGRALELVKEVNSELYLLPYCDVSIVNFE